MTHPLKLHALVTGAALLIGLPACTTAPAPSAEQVHRQAIVLDAHADIALPDTSPLYLGADGQSKVATEKLTAGGVDAVIMALATGPKPRTPEGRAQGAAEIAAKLEAIQTRVAADPDRLTFARTAAEVRAAQAQGKTAIILGFQNALALERDLARIDALYADGVRVFGLTHMGHNDFSDSSRPLFNGETGTYEATEEHGGLSELGRQAVQRIDALGGIVDVSQMSKAATLQAIALSETPIIATHSNAKQLSDVTRNLSDEEIDRIGETGGVIHIAAFSAYLVDLTAPEMRSAIRDVRLAAGLPETYSYPYELYWELDDEAEKISFLTNMRALVGREDVARMVDHIDYVAGRIGIDHVGIGTDFNHGGGIVGFAEADSAQNVTEELLRRGYSPSDVEKIWGGNFLRVLEVSEGR
ncbi:MAG: pyoverdine-tailoring dipeptidase-like protein PvdM [Henriciella sp.]